MAILNDVKRALGIFYSETNKDAEISNIIAGAKGFLLKAGWPSADLAANAETPEAKQAIIIFAKQAINTDPTEMRINPMLVAMIAHARMKPENDSTDPEPEPVPTPTPTPDPDPEPDPQDPDDPTDPDNPDGDGE